MIGPGYWKVGLKTRDNKDDACIWVSTVDLCECCDEFHKEGEYVQVPIYGDYYEGLKKWCLEVVAYIDEELSNEWDGKGVSWIS